MLRDLGEEGRVQVVEYGRTKYYFVSDEFDPDPEPQRLGLAAVLARRPSTGFAFWILLLRGLEAVADPGMAERAWVRVTEVQHDAVAGQQADAKALEEELGIPARQFLEALPKATVSRQYVHQQLNELVSAEVAEVASPRYRLLPKFLTLAVWMESHARMKADLAAATMPDHFHWNRGRRAACEAPASACRRVHAEFTSARVPAAMARMDAYRHGWAQEARAWRLAGDQWPTLRIAVQRLTEQAKRPPMDVG